MKDLGASPGRTNWYIPGERDDLEAFVEERFIESVEGNRVKFHYKGAWLEPQLTTSVTPGDVVWICQFLSQLTDRQWMDAFQAGGYSPADARRYIQRMRRRLTRACVSGNASHSHAALRDYECPLTLGKLVAC